MVCLQEYDAQGFPKGKKQYVPGGSVFQVAEYLVANGYLIEDANFPREGDKLWRGIIYDPKGRKVRVLMSNV